MLRSWSVLDRLQLRALDPDPDPGYFINLNKKFFKKQSFLKLQENNGLKRTFLSVEYGTYLNGEFMSYR